MTGNELAALVGRTGTLGGDTLPLRVTVVDAKWRWGHLRYVVEHAGATATVAAERVRLDPKEEGDGIAR